MNNTTEAIIYKVDKDNRICEMVTENTVINVPVNPSIDISTITSDDPEPRFVNVEVIRAGISGNRRRFNNNVVKEVCDMAPGCQGFFGHPDPSKQGFEFREPQSICVGSMVDHMPDGLDRCIAKVYLFKTSPLREWIPKSIAAGRPMTVSVNGVGDIIQNSDIIDVIHMSDLQSIDWANPGTEGIETSQALSVVREMEDNKGGSKMSELLNAQDIIKNATVTEFKAFNPTGYNAVLAGTTIQELQASNPTLIERIITDNKITELKLVIGGKEESVKITELQGKVSAYESEIDRINGEVEASKITEMKTRLLASMVPIDTNREKISPRITGKTEAEITTSINNEIAYIREMRCNWDNLPAGRNHAESLSNDMQAQMAALFGHKIETK